VFTARYGLGLLILFSLTWFLKTWYGKNNRDVLNVLVAVNVKFLVVLEGHQNKEGPPRIPTVTSVSRTPHVRHMARVQCSYLALSCIETCGMHVRGRP